MVSEGCLNELLAAVAAGEPDALFVLADYYDDCGSHVLASAIRSPGAFLTGSHAYGTPHDKSDVDVCCKVERPELVELGKLYGRKYWNQDNVTCNCRAGNLNLIAASSEKFFAAWEQTTNDLIARKPVTKDEAIKAFDESMRETYVASHRIVQDDEVPF